MKKRILLILLVSVMLLSLLATSFASCKKEEDPEAPPAPPTLTPDYPAPPIDEGAEDVGGDEGKLDAPTGGGAVGMEYKGDVTVDLSDKTVSLHFINPKRSTHNVAIQVVVQGQILAQSGLLTPGKRVSQLTLAEGVPLVAGQVYATDAKIIVRFYDPTTNACAIVNSELAIAVTVQE